jgi:hypothetical protein
MNDVQNITFLFVKIKCNMNDCDFSITVAVKKTKKIKA